MNYKNIIKRLSANKPLLYISPFIIFLLVSYLLFGPAHFTDIHRDLFTPSGDPEAFVWYLRWWPFSLAHGLNPIMERYIYYPSGFNLAWSTSISSLALIMAPFTAIWGAVTSFNILALVALPFSAFSSFLLVHFISKKYWASLLSGFIYGFSSFQLGELLGHPCFYVSFVPPLVVLLIMLRVKNHIGRILFILLLALLLTIQFGISSEFFGSLILFGGAAWILIYIFADKKLKLILFKTSVEMFFAGILTLVLLSPFIYYLIVGYSGVPKVINPPLTYSADLLNYFIPTKITLIGGSLFQHISNNFPGNASEQGAYLSIPLIGFIIWFSAYYWRKMYVKVLAIMAVIIGISSLGPKLHINGVVKFPLPWDITSAIPVLKSMLPTRFPMYLFLIAIIMLAMWFSESPKKKNKTSHVKIVQSLKYVLVIVIIVLLLPKTSNFSWQNLNIPSVFTPKLASKYIGVDKNIVILPYSDGADPMVWQVNSDMKFKLSEGYTGFTPMAFANDKAEQDLNSGQPAPDFTSNFLGFCKTHQVSEVMYTPSALVSSIQVIKEIQNLSWPTITVGNIVIIKVPLQYQ